MVLANAVTLAISEVAAWSVIESIGRLAAAWSLPVSESFSQETICQTLWHQL